MPTSARRWMALCLALTLGLSAGPAGVLAAGPVVLFDEGHGQRFLARRDEPLDLSAFASVLVAEGSQLRVGSEPLTDGRLAELDALVISGAFQPLRPAEVEAVMAFLRDGGRVAIMLHIPFPVASLLHRLGVAFSNGVVRERDGILGDDALNFRVRRLQPHALTEGLDSFNAYGSWALLPEGEGVEILASAGPQAWVDLDGDRVPGPGDAAQSFAVAVTGHIGRGEFVVFGDDAIFQNQFLRGGNKDLAANLARWLAQGGQPYPAIAERLDGGAPGE